MTDEDEKKNTQQKLTDIISKYKAVLSEDEYNQLTHFTEILYDYYSLASGSSFIKSLSEFWTNGWFPLVYPPFYDIESIFKQTEKQKDNIDDYMRIGQELMVGFSDEFLKAIKMISDKKIQGKILDAITKIATNPNTIIGNMMKPLSNDLIGFWRYRIGNFRIIYRYDKEKNTIYLLTFVSRSVAHH
jgi:mRNA-degrading endonuclease RelE of RelBE toxin-antitoxin system